MIKNFICLLGLLVQIGLCDNLVQYFGFGFIRHNSTLYHNTLTKWRIYKAGATISIRCPENDQRSQIIWSKLGIELNVSSARKRFEIQNAIPEDSGCYECNFFADTDLAISSSNKTGGSGGGSVCVEVKKKLAFISKAIETRVILPKNKNIILDCQTNLDDVAENIQKSWMINGKIVSYGSRFTYSSYDSQNDEDVYCVATNGIEVINKKFTISETPIVPELILHSFYLLNNTLFINWYIDQTASFQGVEKINILCNYMNFPLQFPLHEYSATVSLDLPTSFQKGEIGCNMFFISEKSLSSNIVFSINANSDSGNKIKNMIITQNSINSAIIHIETTDSIQLDKIKIFYSINQNFQGQALNEYTLVNSTATSINIILPNLILNLTYKYKIHLLTEKSFRFKCSEIIFKLLSFESLSVNKMDTERSSEWLSLKWKSLPRYLIDCFTVVIRVCKGSSLSSVNECSEVNSLCETNQTTHMTHVNLLNLYRMQPIVVQVKLYGTIILLSKPVFIDLESVDSLATTGSFKSFTHEIFIKWRTSLNLPDDGDILVYFGCNRAYSKIQSPLASLLSNNDSHIFLHHGFIYIRKSVAHLLCKQTHAKIFYRLDHKQVELLSLYFKTCPYCAIIPLITLTIFFIQFFSLINQGRFVGFSGLDMDRLSSMLSKLGLEIVRLGLARTDLDNYHLSRKMYTEIETMERERYKKFSYLFLKSDILQNIDKDIDICECAGHYDEIEESESSYSDKFETKIRLGMISNAQRTVDTEYVAELCDNILFSLEKYQPNTPISVKRDNQQNLFADPSNHKLTGIDWLSKFVANMMNDEEALSHKFEETKSMSNHFKSTTEIFREDLLKSGIEYEFVEKYEFTNLENKMFSYPIRALIKAPEESSMEACLDDLKKFGKFTIFSVLSGQEDAMFKFAMKKNFKYKKFMFKTALFKTLGPCALTKCIVYHPKSEKSVKTIKWIKMATFYQFVIPSEFMTNSEILTLLRSSLSQFMAKYDMPFFVFCGSKKLESVLKTVIAVQCFLEDAKNPQYSIPAGYEQEQFKYVEYLDSLEFYKLFLVSALDSLAFDKFYISVYGQTRKAHLNGSFDLIHSIFLNPIPTSETLEISDNSIQSSYKETFSCDATWIPFGFPQKGLFVGAAPTNALQGKRFYEMIIKNKIFVIVDLFDMENKLLNQKQTEWVYKPPEANQSITIDDMEIQTIRNMLQICDDLPLTMKKVEIIRDQSTLHSFIFMDICEVNETDLPRAMRVISDFLQLNCIMSIDKPIFAIDRTGNSYSCVLAALLLSFQGLSFFKSSNPLKVCREIIKWKKNSFQHKNYFEIFNGALLRLIDEINYSLNGNSCNQEDSAIPVFEPYHACLEEPEAN